MSNWFHSRFKDLEEDEIMECFIWHDITTLAVHFLMLDTLEKLIVFRDEFVDYFDDRFET